MRKIAIANRKGGVGKTCTAVHLAHALALTGKPTLLIDTDTQGQCSKHLGVEPLIGLASLLLDGEDAVFTARAKLDLLSGGMDLAMAEREIGQRDLAVEYALAEAMQKIEDRYEYIIMDGAPGYSRLSVNVLVYADTVVCPVALEGLAIHGLINFLQELGTITERTGAKLQAVLPTFYDRRVKQSEEFIDQLGSHVEHLLKPIPYSVALSEAATRGKTIYEYKRKDRASIEYLKTAMELINGKG